MKSVTEAIHPSPSILKFNEPGCVHPRVSASNRFICTICTKWFGRKDHLQRHLRIHLMEITDPGEFNCKVCHRIFRRKDHLQRHETIHTGAKPYICEHCKRGFRTSYHVKRHVNEVHYMSSKQTINPVPFFRNSYQQDLSMILQEPYACDEDIDESGNTGFCPVWTTEYSRTPQTRTSNPNNFQRNPEIRSEEQYPNSQVTEKNSQSYNKGRIATNRKVVNNHCNRPYPENPRSNERDKILNSFVCKPDPDQNPDPSVRTQSKHRFCPKCLQVYYVSEASEVSLPSFVCDDCKQSFQYKCEQCGKGFKRKAHLERHMSLHTGLKAFECAYCDSKFIEWSTLNRHIGKQHEFEMSIEAQQVKVEEGEVRFLYQSNRGQTHPVFPSVQELQANLHANGREEMTSQSAEKCPSKPSQSHFRELTNPALAKAQVKETTKSVERRQPPSNCKNGFYARFLC